MGREEGLDNDHPRKYIHTLDGLPLRLRSAHYALMENFPGTFTRHGQYLSWETKSVHRFRGRCCVVAEHCAERCADCESAGLPCHCEVAGALPGVSWECGVAEDAGAFERDCGIDQRLLEVGCWELGGLTWGWRSEVQSKWLRNSGRLYRHGRQ